MDYNSNLDYKEGTSIIKIYVLYNLGLKDYTNKH